MPGRKFLLTWALAALAGSAVAEPASLSPDKTPPETVAAPAIASARSKICLQRLYAQRLFCNFNCRAALNATTPGCEVVRRRDPYSRCTENAAALFARCENNCQTQYDRQSTFCPSPRAEATP